MGYTEIVGLCGELLEDLATTDPDSGARIVTADALDSLLERADDPDHLRDPLAQAVYRFIVERRGKIVLTDS